MTAQCGENLDFQGKRFTIAEQPLREWLSENAEHIRFNHIDVSKFMPKRKDTAKNQGHSKVKNEGRNEGTIKPLRFRVVNSAQVAFPFILRNTACYRGYVGTWTVDGDRLYLTQIDGNLVDGRVATLAALFPDEPDRVFARWFSGEIHDDSVMAWMSPPIARSSYGDSKIEPDSGPDLLLRFENGVLVGQGPQEVTVQQPDSDSSGDAEAKP